MVVRRAPKILKALFLLAVLLGLGVLMVLAFLVSPAPARADRPLSALEAYIWQSVVEDGDALVILRYELPTDDWAVSSGGPGPEAAQATVEKGSQTKAYRPIPRVGYGMAGIYLTPTQVADIVWGASDVRVCVREDPVYPSPSVSCVAPTWRPATSVDQGRQNLTADLPQMVYRMETEDPEVPTGTYVQNGLITLDGYQVVSLAVPSIAALAPDAFTVAVVEGMQGTIGTGPGTYEQSYSSYAQSQQSVQGLVETVQAFFGQSANWRIIAFSFGALLALVILGALVLFVPVSPSVALAGGASLLVPSLFLVGVYLDIVPRAVAFFLALLLTVGFAAWVFQRVPQ